MKRGPATWTSRSPAPGVQAVINGSRYLITPVQAPDGQGWQITCDGRQASHLIFRRITDAVALAEWDAAAKRQRIEERERATRRRKY